MQLYYVMYAVTRFKFTVFTKKTGRDSFPVFYPTSKRDMWQKLQLTVGTNDSYQVLFQNTYVQNGQSTDLLALDDIYFTDGACQEGSDIGQLCTFSYGDLCGYTLSSSGSRDG